MSATLLTGDALTVLRTLPDGAVRCCVTSPPYWGLRDYGTAAWEGGDPACDHRQHVSYRSSTLGASTGGRSESTHQRSIVAQATPYANKCGKCAARRVDAQLGLERTPEEYVAGMVAVFREVRRVLADDGTLWLNLGDSYTSGGRKTRDPGQSKIHPSYEGDGYSDGLRPDDPDGLKPKDLVGIPWRVAFALQSDGWYLRSDIIWAKPNPMPESVTDRPTKSHEYLFLLSKSERYYYDADAVAEPATRADTSPATQGRLTQGGFISRVRDDFNGTRNSRTVWTIPTQPYAGAHFATFPEELARRCIMAGSAPTDTVLDPFSGSGTVAAVAVGNGRAAIGIELNPKYQDLARHRIGPMLCGDAA